MAKIHIFFKSGQKYAVKVLPLHCYFEWRDAGVVERTALEMRHTGNRIQGSNPCLSANQERK